MSEHLNALPTGFRLQEYEILRVLGVGGFGITYLCFDHNLDQARAIKEYLPNDLAVRLGDNTVQCKSANVKKDFEDGLNSFLDEARRLAKFEHPNICKVHRCFSERGTAYIVMEYAEGDTLSELLANKGALSESELKDILLPILDGLEEVHKFMIHRDIKPANIIIRDADSSPVLLDFGAARQTVSSLSKPVTAIVTAGFAPLEQYSSHGNQGPWTDIYALGCLCYRALTGEIPKEATYRTRNDPLVPISVSMKGKADVNFLAAIDWALAVYEEDRPQDIQQWREALVHGKQHAGVTQRPEGATKKVTSGALKSQQERPQKNKKPANKKNTGSVGLIAAGIVVLAIIGGAGYYLLLMDAGPVETPGVVNNTNGSVQGISSAVEQSQEENIQIEESDPGFVIGNIGQDLNLGSPGTEFVDELIGGGYGPVLITLPAGQMQMGSSSENDEQPVHTVNVDSFAIGRFEVKVNEFQQYLSSQGVRASTLGDDLAELPAVNVSWEAARDFANWLTEQTGETYRLPSEAEWEYAARAGTSSSYSWGDSIGQANANCNGCTTGAVNSGLVPVGSHDPNPFGLYDLHGNAQEWVTDCARDTYIGAPTDGSVWESPMNSCSRVIRGGSWRDQPYYLRASYRNWAPQTIAEDTIGFRVVRELD